MFKEKHAADVDLARSEEKRKGLLREIEVERNRAEDYRCDVAAALGKTSLLVQRNAAMKSEVELGQQTVKRLETAFETERTDNAARTRKLRRDISALLLAIESESKTRVDLETKLAKSGEFLSSIMSINEALISTSHAKRDAGLIQRGRSRTDSRNYYSHSPSRKDGENSVGGSSSSTKKKTTKKKKKTLKKRSSSAGAGELEDATPLRRRNKAGPSSPSPSPRNNLPPPPPRQVAPRSRPTNHPSKTVMRSTRASRAAAEKTKEKLLQGCDGNGMTLKDRIRIANFGPVPFLPAPRLHSFNVLAAVSEAVRTESGEVPEYRVHHHRGSISLSPPRGGAVLREKRLEVSLPGVILGPGMSTSPGKSTRKAASSSPPKERVGGTPKKSSGQKLEQQQQQQQLPLELAALLSSLEDEFDEISSNYNALLSQSKPNNRGADGTTGRGEEEGSAVPDADGAANLLSLAEKMQRKEGQMLLFKNAVKQATKGDEAATLPPQPPQRQVNPLNALSNL